MIPKPLARVRVTYGRAFEVAEGEAGLADGLAQAIESLNEVSRMVP